MGERRARAVPIHVIGASAPHAYIACEFQTPWQILGHVNIKVMAKTIILQIQLFALEVVVADRGVTLKVNFDPTCMKVMLIE